MKTIDVEGLPERVAQALQAIVQTLREELRAEQTRADGRPKVRLRTWPGTVRGPLTREEIYDDAF